MTESPVTVGRYHVARLIAHGGMGSLYLARDPAIDRLVAIKLLKDGFDDEAARERFAREARATGRLCHPNIVTIFDVGEHESRPFIAMEYVSGETLAQLIHRRAPLSITDKLALLEDLCSALHYAHNAGIVHRDIKPANIILDTHGILKILDFGIARAGESAVTRAGDMVGTLNYMSPEQLVGEHVDHRADVYAVGALAYELLSYEKAFPGTVQDGALFRILHSAPVPLETLVPGADPELSAIVDRAMVREVDERYQNLDELRRDLSAVRARLLEEEAASSDAETRLGPAEWSSGAPVPTPFPGKPPTGQTPSGIRDSSSRSGRATQGSRGSGLSASGRRGSGSGVSATPALVPGQYSDLAADAPVTPRRPGYRRLALLAITAVAVTLALVGWRNWFTASSLPSSPAGVPAPPSSAPAPDRARSRTVVDERLSTIRVSARQQIRAGEYQRALDMVTAGLVIDPADSELNGLMGELRRGAQDLALKARRGASSRGATEASSFEFRDGRAREREADVLEQSGDRAGGIRALWAAASLYADAAKVASRRRNELPAEPPRPPARTDTENTNPPPVPPERPPPPTPTLESLKSLPGTAETPAPPPVAGKADAPAPTSGDVARDARASDVAAIRDILRSYSDAYRSRDLAAVKRILPALTSQQLRNLDRDFSNYRSYDVELTDVRIVVDHLTATVTCQAVRSFVTRNGVAGGNTVATTFRLRKVGSTWVIERVESG